MYPRGRGCKWEDSFQATIKGREIKDGIELSMEGPVEIDEHHYTVAQAIRRFCHLLGVGKHMAKPTGYCMDYRISITIWGDAVKRYVSVSVYNRMAGGEIRRYHYRYANPTHAIMALIERLGLATE